jgi:DNA-directed RNA polymerase specialized sigma24 family protein
MSEAATCPRFERIDDLATASADSQSAMNELCAICLKAIGSWAQRRYGKMGGGWVADEAVSLAATVIPGALRCWRRGEKPFYKWLYICVHRRWNRKMVPMIERGSHYQELTLRDARRFVARTEDGVGEEVREILGKMDKTNARLLEMVYGIGVGRETKTEIGRMTGVKRRTVGDRVRAALDDFREKWGEE